MFHAIKVTYGEARVNHFWQTILLIRYIYYEIPVRRYRNFYVFKKYFSSFKCFIIGNKHKRQQNVSVICIISIHSQNSNQSFNLKMISICRKSSTNSVAIYLGSVI